MASEATMKVTSRFFTIVRNWRIIVEEDASNPKLAPAWQLISAFPDAMADYAHWIDTFKVALSVERVLSCIVEVPHTEGHTEPFLVLLDKDNARLFMIAMRPRYQVSLSFYEATREPMTEKELQDTFEWTQLEAYRRMGIVATTMASQLDIAPPPWNDVTQMLTQLRPMAFYSEELSAVSFFDVMTMHSSDKAWYDFVWNACRAYRLNEKNSLLTEDGKLGTAADVAAVNAEADAVMKAPKPVAKKPKAKPKPKAKTSATKQPDTRARKKPSVKRRHT